MSPRAPSTRPFRFGLSAVMAPSGAAWRDQARWAEAAGFDVLHVADHVTSILSPWTAAAVAAEATDRLHVGTLVLNNDLRHPVLTAREAATLGLLTEGRFELGVGAGHMKSEYDAIGLRFDPPEVRVPRFVEAVRLVAQLLDGQPVDHDGNHYRVHGDVGFPKLDATTRVPLLVGGNGRQVLAAAARHADAVGFVGFSHTRDATSVRLTHFTSTGLDEQVAWVRDQAGDRFSDLELHALVQRVVTTDDRQTAAAELAAEFEGALSAEQVLDSPYLLIGTHDQMADILRERRDRFGITHWTVFGPVPGTSDSSQAFAPVIERLR